MSTRSQLNVSGKHVMAGNRTRNEKIAEMDARRRAQRVELESRVSEITAKGYVLDSETRTLIKAFASTLGESEVRRVLSGGIEQRSDVGPDPNWDDIVWVPWSGAPPDVRRERAPLHPGTDIMRTPPVGLSVAGSNPSVSERALQSSRPQRSRRGVSRLALIGAVTAVAAIVIVLAFGAIHGWPWRGSAVHGAIPTTPLGRTSVLSGPAGQEAQIISTIHTRYALWNASRSCACDRTLATVESAPILHRNLVKLDALRRTGGHWAIIPQRAHVDWVRLTPPDHALVQVSASDRQLLLHGAQQRSCFGGQYRETYNLIRSNGVWKIMNRHVVQAQPACISVSPTQPAAGKISTITGAINNFVRVWDDALATNDATSLSSVAVAPALSRLKTELSEHAKSGVQWGVTELQPPSLTPIANSSSTATVSVRRVIRIVIERSANGQPEPSDLNNTNRESLTQTYTLVKSGSVWIVQTRTPY